MYKSDENSGALLASNQQQAPEHAQKRASSRLQIALQVE
jgi:hypothetical protein